MYWGMYEVVNLKVYDIVCFNGFLFYFFAVVNLVIQTPEMSYYWCSTMEEKAKNQSDRKQSEREELRVV